MTTVAVHGGERRFEEALEGSGVPLGLLAAPGKLVELSGVGAAARHSTAAAMVRQAQAEGETTVWVQSAGGPLYPPDLAESGVDLAALAVVQVPTDRGEVGLARAAELLLRSGAFGLCVLDLSAPPTWLEGQVAKDMSERPVHAPRLRGEVWQARLAALARMHASRVVLLTRAASGRASLGPMIGLRVEARRVRRAPGVFAIRPEVVKHKGGALIGATTLRRGPWGLA
jgi:recombination protein RecA